MRIGMLLLSVVFVVVGCVSVQSPEQGGGAAGSELPSGESLFRGEALETLRRYNSPGMEQAVMEVVGVEHFAFDKAFHVETGEKAVHVWDYSLLSSNNSAVVKGDVVFVSFYVRAVGGAGEMRVGISEPMPSYLQLASIDVATKEDWQQVRLGFRSNYDYAKGGFDVAFMMGFDPQVMEVGGFEFINYGSEISIEDLDFSESAVVHEGIRKSADYEGRDPDAQWRKDAFKRIEKVRKGDLSVSVQDGDGNAVADAQVLVKQKGHKFWFGTEVRALTMLSDDAYLAQRNISLEDAQKYRDTVKELFNVAAFGQAMVWHYWDAHGKETTKKVVDEWLKPNGIAFRGIPLVWSGRQVWKNPEGTVDLPVDELRKKLRGHLIELMETHRGSAVMWDVLNEPVSEPDFINKLGIDEAVGWFKLAREMAPEAKLYCNDYGLLQDHDKLRKFIALMQRLIDKGAPIDGVSPQSHLFPGQGAPPSIASVKEAFDMLAELGLEIYPDQFQAVIADEQIHADYTRDFYILAFSHPAVVGVTHWGFWEGEIWMRDAAWFRRDWSEKPIAKVYKDLVYNKWWTDVRGQTDEQGMFKIRGFLGEYEVVAISGERTGRAGFSLSGDGKTVLVTLEP